MKEINEVIGYFPEGIRNEINKLLLKYDDLYKQREEIRIRNNKPIIKKAQNRAGFCSSNHTYTIRQTSPLTKNSSFFYPKFAVHS